MSILNYLPTFKVVEQNRSTGLVTGYVLSQYKAAAAITTKTVNGVDFLENGLIVGLNADLTIGNFVAATHKQPFIVFAEELNTFMPGLKYFATEEDANGEIYPRAVALMVGDTWTTNNYTGAITNKYAAVGADGVIKTQATTLNAIFAVEESTLPNGEDAVRVTYLGTPLAA